MVRGDTTQYFVDRKGSGMKFSGILAIVTILLTSNVAAQNMCGGYPLEDISKNHSRAGWDPKKISLVEEMYNDIGSVALMVLKDGKVVLSYGDITRDYNIHSIRKSFLTALIGKAVARGEIDLDQSMAALGIDDKEALSDTEKSATFRQLIKARSGIYHPAAYETKAMAAARPQRFSHKPGTFWYYNNWDFNAAGRIYEMKTGRNIHIAFRDEVAQPLCMQDYNLSLMKYHYEETTLYPAYPFRMSTRDLALFGQLYLQKGLWKGQNILPEGWVDESTRLYSKTDRTGTSSGYGYMWWVTREDNTPEEQAPIPIGSYTANGAGGHRITVLPSMNMVVVNRMDTDLRGGPRLSGEKYDELLRLIIDAQDQSHS